MGKKRVAKKGEKSSSIRRGTGKKLARKRLERGVLHIQATYNNTKLLLAESDGSAVAWSSSGALGFAGAKKGTPFAAAQVGDLVGEHAKTLGLAEVSVIVRGVGAGRESAIRSFVAKSGALISTIEDRTPMAHNGPRPRKARRV